jgi:beta-galactosidase
MPRGAFASVTVATDNGDPTDHTPFGSHDRNAFNGLCQVIVRAKPPAQPGRIIAVTATVSGLPSARAQIRIPAVTRRPQR